MKRVAKIAMLTFCFLFLTPFISIIAAFAVFLWWVSYQRKNGWKLWILEERLWSWWKGLNCEQSI